jgi:hypothetical protein
MFISKLIIKRINFSLLKYEKKLAYVLSLPVVETKRRLQWTDHVDWLFFNKRWGHIMYVIYDILTATIS